MKVFGLLLALGIIACTSAHASVHQGVTVAEAKKMRDDRNVVVEGKITGRAGDDDYWLEDATGKIRIDADDDDDDDGGDYRLVGKTVRVVGEIDSDDGRVEIDSDSIQILN